MKKLPPAQEQLLDIYKSFKQFCDKHNLRYYAVAGTAIGAIRHHGFIPWDDDIDLGMPIEDFNKLKKLASKYLPKNLSFKESYWMGGKIHNIKTTVIDVRFINRPQDYHGLYIDIFPLIGLPDDEPTRRNFIDDIKTFQANAELLEFYPEVSSFSAQEILNWKKYLQSAYSFDSSQKLAAFCYFMCDGDGIRNPITVPFEDTEIPISSNYDWDLRNHFGDYMTPPPETERKTHDKYHITDLKTPFSKYAKEYHSCPHWVQKLIGQNHLIEGELTQFTNSLQYMLKEKESQQLRNSKNHSITQKNTTNKIFKSLKAIKKRLSHEN